MKKRMNEVLRRFAEWAIRAQRYRYLRAHLWEDAINEMDCGSCA